VKAVHGTVSNRPGGLRVKTRHTIATRRTDLPMSGQVEVMGSPIAVSGGITSGRSSVTHQYSRADN
jgi:hypothetical protein